MSFNGLGTFRQGQWQQFRRFVLNERRDVFARIAVIKSELDRIGFIRVAYDSTTDADGVTTVSEKRVGITVNPLDSTLAKLVGVYTVMGGNPLDISMFMHPDKVFITDVETYIPYPSGGQLYPQTAPPAYNGDVFTQGLPSVETYNTAGRRGGRRNIEDSDMVLFMSQAQRWVQKEIAYKRNNLEARIIKLCDLREQLEAELDDLMRATGDALALDVPFDPERYNSTFTVAQTVAIIDSIWYDMGEDGTADFTSESDNLGAYPNLVSDLQGLEDYAAT